MGCEVRNLIGHVSYKSSHELALRELDSKTNNVRLGAALR